MDIYKKTMKKIIIFQLIICFMTLCCSCGLNLDKKAENHENDKKKISIYSLEFDQTMQDAILRFKNENPDVIVNEEFIEKPSNMRTRLNTELMAGEGPDIIKGNLSMFNSIYKILNTGVFCDINEFIKNDKELDMSVYNTSVINTGIYNGKRYFIPLGFAAPYLWTTKNALGNSDISFDMNNWTWDQMKEKGKLFINNSKGGGERYIFPDQYSLLYCLLMTGGINYIDYSERKAYFDTPQFMELLETYKSLCNDILSENYQEKYSNGYYDMYKENSLFAVVGPDGKALNPGMLWMLNSSVKSFLNEDILLYSFPTRKKEEKPMANITSIVAINNSSESKQSAYNFVKLLLSKEAQTSDYFMNCEGIPVNNEAIDFMIKKYNGSEGVSKIVTNSVEIPTVSLPMDLAEQAKKVVIGIEKCEIIDQSVLRFIVEEVQNFMEGEISATQAGEKINNKVQLFLSE